MLIAEPFPSRKSISRNLIIEPFNRQALNCSKNAEYCDGNEDPENDTKKRIEIEVYKLSTTHNLDCWTDFTRIKVPTEIQVILELQNITTYEFTKAALP